MLPLLALSFTDAKGDPDSVSGDSDGKLRRIVPTDRSELYRRAEALISEGEIVLRVAYLPRMIEVQQQLEPIVTALDDTINSGLWSSASDVLDRLNEQIAKLSEPPRLSTPQSTLQQEPLPLEPPPPPPPVQPVQPQPDEPQTVESRGTEDVDIPDVEDSDKPQLSQFDEEPTGMEEESSSSEPGPSSAPPATPPPQRDEATTAEDESNEVFAGSSQAVYSYGSEDDQPVDVEPAAADVDTVPGPSGGRNVYIVKGLLASRTVRKKGRKQVQYLIRWEGFDESHDSWLPARNILDKELIAKFKDTGPDAFDSSTPPVDAPVVRHAVEDDDGLNIDRVAGRRVRVAGTREVIEYYALPKDDATGESGLWVTALPDTKPIDDYLTGRPTTDLTGRGWLLKVEARSNQKLLFARTGSREHKYLLRFEGELPNRKPVLSKLFRGELTPAAQQTVDTFDLAQQEQVEEAPEEDSDGESGGEDGNEEDDRLDDEDEDEGGGMGAETQVFEVVDDQPSVTPSMVFDQGTQRARLSLQKAIANLPEEQPWLVGSLREWCSWRSYALMCRAPVLSSLREGELQRLVQDLYEIDKIVLDRQFEAANPKKKYKSDIDSSRRDADFAVYEEGVKSKLRARIMRRWLLERQRRARDQAKIDAQIALLDSIDAGTAGELEAGWWVGFAKPRLRMQEVKRFLSGGKMEEGGGRGEPVRRFLTWWRDLSSAAERDLRLDESDPRRNGGRIYEDEWYTGESAYGSCYSNEWPEDANAQEINTDHVIPQSWLQPGGIVLEHGFAAQDPTIQLLTLADENASRSDSPLDIWPAGDTRVEQTRTRVWEPEIGKSNLSRAKVCWLSRVTAHGQLCYALLEPNVESAPATLFSDSPGVPTYAQSYEQLVSYAASKDGLPLPGGLERRVALVCSYRYRWHNALSLRPELARAAPFADLLFKRLHGIDSIAKLVDFTLSGNLLQAPRLNPHRPEV